MKNLQRLSGLLLALLMLVVVSGTALAAAPSFTDVPADAWYRQAVDYVQQEELMNGSTATTFAPNDTMTRSMLATVLYRVAGRPAVTGSDSFPDTQPGSWYADAALWASSTGIINGYDSGLFGVNDPVTREQIAALLWRYEGRPEAEPAEAFADESAISSWAATAVAWARAQGIINGKAGNLFDPAGNATRAEVATILMNYTQDGQPAPEPTPEPTPETGTRVLIAYFSATGTTETIATHLDAILDADLYEITPEIPYTAADLDYHDSDSRSQVERQDPTARPAISGGVDNMADYDVIFLGYPIWNGQAPKIISTFLEAYDLTGKTIVPFCTSGSSGIGSSATALQPLTSGADWLPGQRFGGSATQSAVATWVDGLGLELPHEE